VVFAGARTPSRSTRWSADLVCFGSRRQAVHRLKAARILDVLKKEFIVKGKNFTLEEALKDSDVFIGLSKGNVLSQDMVKSMAKNPIVFAMANPDP